MNFKCTQEFEKDFKRLFKKFKTLDNDFCEFKKILGEFPLGIGKHFNVINRVGIGSVSIIKARFFSQSLKKKDLRIIYAYVKDHEITEFSGIEFIELYFKGDRVNEDKTRIKEYLEKFL